MGSYLLSAGSPGARVTEAASVISKPGERGLQVGRLPERSSEEPKPLGVAIGHPKFGEVFQLIPHFEVEDALVDLHDLGLSVTLLLLVPRPLRLLGPSARLEDSEAHREQLSYSGWNRLPVAEPLGFRAAEDRPAEGGGVNGRARGPLASPADGLVRVPATAPEPEFIQNRWG